MTWKGFGNRGRRIVEVTFHYLRDESDKDNETVVQYSRYSGWDWIINLEKKSLQGYLSSIMVSNVTTKFLSQESNGFILLILRKLRVQKMVLLKGNLHQLSACEYLLTSSDRSVCFSRWFSSALESWISLSFSNFIFFSFLNLQKSVFSFLLKIISFLPIQSFTPSHSHFTLVLFRHFFKLTFPPYHSHIATHCPLVASCSAKNFHHRYKKNYI